MPVWEALEARALGVDVERVGGAPLVGREQELAAPRDVRPRRREREPQLVTLVGVPGIGKSRLVSELFATIESGALGLVYWRQRPIAAVRRGRHASGRSARWSRPRPGILESDDAEHDGGEAAAAVERCSSRTPRSAAGSSAISARSRARRLTRRQVGSTRDEAFAAWRRFLEAIADERPLVLVFEDLHWADDALLDFVDYLVDRARASHCSSLCTARPELLVRRPGWGGGKVNCVDDPLDAALRRTRRRARSRAARSARRSTPTCRRTAARPRRWEPALRRGVRPHARRASRTRPSLPRQCKASSPPASTRFPRGEGPPPGRRGRRAGLLARGSRSGSAGRSRSGCTPSSGRSSYDASVDLRRRRGRVRLPPRARA